MILASLLLRLIVVKVTTLARPGVKGIFEEGDLGGGEDEVSRISKPLSGQNSEMGAARESHSHRHIL